MTPVDIGVIALFIFVASFTLWFMIYLTIGIDVSGRDSGVKTTNEFFVAALIFIGLVCALVYIVVRDIL